MASGGWVVFVVEEGSTFYLVTRMKRPFRWTEKPKDATRFSSQRVAGIAAIIPRLIAREHGETGEIEVRRELY